MFCSSRQFLQEAITEDIIHRLTILLSCTKNGAFKHNNENVTAKIDYQRKMDKLMDFRLSKLFLKSKQF